MGPQESSSVRPIGSQRPISVFEAYRKRMKRNNSETTKLNASNLQFLTVQ